MDLRTLQRKLRAYLRIKNFVEKTNAKATEEARRRQESQQIEKLRHSLI